MAHTVVNTVAMDSGIICDGAKASCAAKIAAAVDAGLLGLAMYRSGNQFFGGDGIVKKGVENTIANVGRLARLGMAQTDQADHSADDGELTTAVGQPYAYRAGTQGGSCVPAVCLRRDTFCRQFFCFASGGVQTPEISPSGAKHPLPHLRGR